MLSYRLTLSLLLLVAVVQQYRYISTAVMPAQDAVDFVSVAQRIEREGLAATIRHESVPPLFPATIFGVHAALAFLGLSEDSNWGLAAQIAAAVPLVIAVVPVYWTALRLTGPRAALFAAILFCFLPELARLGGDGISDATHLCLAAWALWAGVAAYDTAKHNRSGPLLPSLAAGLFIAAALWARSEAVVIAIVVLCGGLIRSILEVTNRKSPISDFKPSTAHRLAFTVGLAVWTMPFVAAGITEPRELMTRLRGGGAPTEDVPLNAVPPTQVAAVAADYPTLLGDGEPFVFGHKDRSRSSRFHGLSATVVRFVNQLAAATGYLVCLPACVGFIARRHGNRPRIDILFAAIVVVHLTIVFLFAWRNGYLSARHLLLTTLVLLPYAGLGIVVAGQWLATRAVKLTLAGPETAAAAIALALTVACVFATTRPLHESQRAHRQATHWLQSAAARPGAILDQHGFTALASGRTTYRFDSAEAALADPQLAYVLVERADLEAAGRRGESLRTVFGTADRAAVVFVRSDARPDRDLLVFQRTAGSPPQTTDNLLTQRQPNHAR